MRGTRLHTLCTRMDTLKVNKYINKCLTHHPISLAALSEHEEPPPWLQMQQCLALSKVWVVREPHVHGRAPENFLPSSEVKAVWLACLP